MYLAVGPTLVVKTIQLTQAGSGWERGKCLFENELRWLHDLTLSLGLVVFQCQTEPRRLEIRPDAVTSCRQA